MKRFWHIVLLLTLALSWCGSLWAQKPKLLQDVTSTEGREFFVAWLPNGGSAPTDVDLKLQLIANARKSTTIVVEMPNGTTTNHPIAAGGSVVITIQPSDLTSVYWDPSTGEEEIVLNKGIRVYSTNGERFTLYTTNQIGTLGSFSFDGAHILPVEALSTEYMVQTSDGDAIATEFVVMSTKPGQTNVSIDLKVNSRKGNVQHLDVTLNGSKQIYIVRSKAPDSENPDDIIDLSGSTICADQPIAVWSGNQYAIIPNQQGLSNDHAYDQLLPINKWGKTFMVPMTAVNTQLNIMRIVAMQDGTDVTLKRGNAVVLSKTLASKEILMQRMTQNVNNTNPQNATFYVEASKPIQVYLYTTSAGVNNWYDDYGNNYLPSNPSMTLIPPLEFLTDTTIFRTFNGGEGSLVHMVNLIALRSQINNIKIDGATKNGWKTIPANNAYSQLTVEVTDGTHTITAPQKSFTGYAFGISEGEAYSYPVGYDFTPKPDSLFLFDNYNQYTVRESEWKEKNISNTEGGWYLNKILQDNGTYLLDSIFVCDSTILKFPINTHTPWSKVRWEIDGSIQGSSYFTPKEQLPSSVSRPELEHQFHLLPIEENNDPFEDFEVRGILFHAPIFCEIPEDKWERDTFNTVVRVLRQYNDTTWRAICVGDTVQFFKDTVWKVSPRPADPVAGRDYILQVTVFNDTTHNLSKGLYKYGLGATTITRSYTSSGGCDSLSTLKLFVCSPSFEHRDTVVCQDYISRLDYGDFFKRFNNTNKWPVADTVLYDTIRAKDCMRSPEWQDFAPHCRSFNGCDSVLELHLVVKKVFNNSYPANICMSQLASMGGTYVWREKGSDRVLGEFNPDTMKLDSQYIFRKNFKYVECTDCPRGGCDSVRNTLRLMFVSDAGQTHTVHVCQGESYTYTNMTARTTFNSAGKLCNTPYPVTLTVQVRGTDEQGHSIVMCEFEDVVTFYVDTVYKDQMTYDTICWDLNNPDQTYDWGPIHPNYRAIPITGDGVIRLTDVLKTHDTDCDSICKLVLTVGKPYDMPTVEEICDDGSFTWQDTLFYGINYKGTKPAKSKRVTGSLYTSSRKMASVYGCDSILTLNLTIWPTYTAERKDTAICANETYTFYGTQYNTASDPWTPGRTYELKYTDHSIHGCDSSVVHNVTVYPYYPNEREPNDTVCQVLNGTAYYEWEGADHAAWNARHPQSLNRAGTVELVDNLTTVHGCDSIIHRTLVIMPSYDQHFSHTMSSEDYYIWEKRIYAGLKATFENDEHLPVILCSSNMTVVDSLHTEAVGNHSCDSVRTLDLKIGQVFRDTVYDATCDNCGTYNWVLTSPITGRDTTIYITDLPEKYTEKIYYDSLLTGMGYDSIYVLRLTAYPSYDFQDGGEVCQGEAFVWNDHMPMVYGPIMHHLYVNGREVTEIPTDRNGIITVIDSMKTDTIYTNPKTGFVKPMHCDSVWTLTLTVHPTYNSRYVELTDHRSMASNDTILHFTQPKTLFVGYSFDYDAAGVTKAELESTHERVVYIPASDGKLHRDSVVNTSQFGCDSVHYVDIAICEVKFTQLYDSIADNDSTWHFGGETAGRQHTLPLITGEEFHTYDDGTPVDYSVADGRTVREYLLVDTLLTANGCDSIVHNHLSVFPSYRFRFDTAVCSNTRYDWRVLTKLNEQRTGFYYDSVNYTVGTHTFDSVYVLYLDVMPSGYWQYDTTLCMNDTIWWHYKEVYYRPGGLTYVEADYQDGSSPCGEKHHLDLTFMPFYGATLVEYDTICQGETGDTYVWMTDENIHSEALRDAYGRPVTEVPADITGEFVYYDSLKTKSCGCDSTYTLHLVVKPAYHFRTDTAVCPGESFEWIVNGVSKGVYVSDVTEHIYDTIPGVTAHNCDSTYYLHVFVDQPYNIPVDTVVCAVDGHFEWTGDNGLVNYDDLIADSRNWQHPQEFFDTLRTQTVRGKCDSTMYLHLTIAPSADSIWTDTICVGETYKIYEYEYTESGVYSFRHANYWGCDVNYQLTLVAFEPTKVTILPEPVCINDAGQDYTYTIRYTYTGDFPPISYTVRYDSIAQSVGFEEQEHIVIDKQLIAGNEYELYVPTPRIDVRENYPRPDHYYATIAFENGVCISDSLMTFPMTITMSYPNWILEQRHGDVIAILNEQYNGGYTWTEYQWYEGDSMLVGQTRPYLHIPTGLTPGAYYHVELTRTDETVAFPTCEIQAIANPINNDFEPTMGYLAVTPTCIVTGHPVTYILSRKGGTYRISSSNGRLVSEGSFTPDATPVQLPALDGLYIIQLWSDETPEEPYRAIKVLVREQCPNCDTSSF